MKKSIARTIRLFASLLVALAVLPHAAWAANTVTGELTETGAWAAYSFPYAGDGSQVDFILNYTPADLMTDQAVSLDLYSPTNPPPGGERIATGGQGERPGQKRMVLGTDVGGTYILIVTNWDVASRPVQFVLTTESSLGRPGPDLTFVSSSAQVRPPAPAEAPPALPATEPSGQASVTGELPSTHAWAAFTLVYPGDRSEILFSLSYTPADLMSDEAVSLDLYSPASPPPSGERIATGDLGDRPGQKQLSLSSDLGGAYVVIITNWDVDGRTVQFSLTTTSASGRQGPALSFLSSGT